MDLWKNNYSDIFLFCSCYCRIRSKILTNKGPSIGTIIFNQGLLSDAFKKKQKIKIKKILI